MGKTAKGGGQKRDLLHMIQSCDAELRENPHSAPLLRRRGEAKRKLHRFEEAVADFDDALALEPANALALAGRGSALRALGRHTQALASLDAALRLEPRNSSVLMARGVALQALGRYIEGEADLDAALALQPLSAFGLQLRGELRRKLGKHNEAIADYNQALAIAPRYVPALAGRGAAHRGSGRHREAIADYNAALAIEPYSAAVLSGRGAAKLDVGQRQEALSDFLAALEIDPHDEFANWGRGAAGGHQALLRTVALVGLQRPELNAKYMERGQPEFKVQGYETYWSADGQQFLYYSKKEFRWKGSHVKDLAKIKAGGSSGLIGAPQGYDILSPVALKGWHEWDGAAWKLRSKAGVARAQAALQTILLAGFGRAEMNVKYTERQQPEFAVAGRPTFWSTDCEFFLYWSAKETRWKASRASDLAKIKAGGSSGYLGAPVNADICSPRKLAKGWHEFDGTAWALRSHGGVARLEQLAVPAASGYAAFASAEQAAKRQKTAHRAPAAEWT